MKIVTAAIIVQDGNVLLTRRGPNEKLAGFWEFPGGKVEHGETLSECLQRELLEELGIKVNVFETIAETIYRYDHGSFNLVGLRTEIISGNIQLTVHDRAEWVPLGILLDYKLAPADIPIAKKLLEEYVGN